MQAFSDKLSACGTLDDVRLAFSEEVAQHGYTACACRAFVPADGGAKSQIIFRHWPRNWAALSDQKGYSTNSFVIAAARRRIAPFTWLDALGGRELTLAERNVLDAAREWGWQNGFVLPVHGPGGYFAMISMASPERDLDLGVEQRARLQMSAMLAHERGLALANLAVAQRPRDILSSRELECLRWVAAGKTDWEIGVILAISAATVKFHVDRARIKLGARSRAQAVARLMLEGLY